MIRINVINSIKGGCGKSTLSLYLADYMKRKGSTPVILDLDICGTSWQKNFKSFFVEKKEFDKRFVFINDLIFDFNNGITGHFIANMNIASEGSDTFEDYQLQICMADPKSKRKIHDEQLDLFEAAIFKLIKTIIDDYYNDDSDCDLIFDMPPGYEDHAECVINHLLFDINSQLIKYLDKNYKGKYEIHMIMASGFNRASVEMNIEYIQRLYNNGQNYSCIVNKVLKEENIAYVFIDISDVCKGSDIGDNFFNIEKNKVSEKSPVLKVEHLSELSANSSLKMNINEESEDTRLVINKNDRTCFTVLFDKIYPSLKSGKEKESEESSDDINEKKTISSGTTTDKSMSIISADSVTAENKK